MSTSNEISQDDQIIHYSTVRRINNLLNSSKTRIQGLELLNAFLPYCPDDDFLHFCISWMQNCCKIDGLSKSRDVTIKLLRSLLKISSNYQELKKPVSFFISTRYFDFFFKYFLNSPAGWSCTETCLLCYRGACGPFQENLEKCIKNEINKNVKISNIISRCCALMPSVGGGGKDGINYESNWKNSFNRFLNICHSVLNDLFADIELQDYEIHEDFHDRGDKSIQHLVILLYNYCGVLNCMLLNQYPTSKSVPSDLILQLICRGLAVNQKNTTGRETTNMISLQKVLPDVHCSLFSLLNALIVTCKNQMLPYSHLICKLIKQNLEWTEPDFTYGSEEPLGRLRALVYETLCNWLAVARNGSCIESVSGIISNAINDIKSKKEVIFLKESKIQKQSKNSQQTTQRIDVAGSTKLCLAALKTLQFLLRFGGVLLRPEDHKYLQEVVVKLLIEVQKNSGADGVVPFASSTCRMELYSLLLELVCHPSPKWPPPTNFALRLFTRGINDVSPQVSLFCSGALNFSSIIIHSQFDNGGFPPCEMPENNDRMEAEKHWREPGEVEKEKGAEVVGDEFLQKADSFFELSKTDSPEKLSVICGESEVSSDEDSRNTVTFLKDALDLCKKNASLEEKKEESSQVNLTPSEPLTKRRRTLKNDLSQERTSSPSKGKPLENDLSRKKHESCNLDTNSAKSVSPESTNEGQPKARYFLRSKSQGSSEEPEDASKTSSPDSLKSTPAKNLARSAQSGQSAKKRPRAKSAAKIETKNKISDKNNHDDEDIKGAFYDSFVD